MADRGARPPFPPAEEPDAAGKPDVEAAAVVAHEVSLQRGSTGRPAGLGMDVRTRWPTRQTGHTWVSGVAGLSDVAWGAGVGPSNWAAVGNSFATPEGEASP